MPDSFASGGASLPQLEKEKLMKADPTHESAVAQFVEADGVRRAFRRIGAATGWGSR